MIQVNDISYYSNSRGRGKAILNGLSFSIRAGALTVLLGPNGAGKSTFLRLLSGERRPYKGTILWNGREVHSLAPGELALRRGVLTQQYSMSLPFTVEEVVMMGRYPHHGNGHSDKDGVIVLECLREMQAEHLAQRLFNTLSGGEQQRVQMARVLAQLTGPVEWDSMLLLDEPTASMDWLHQQLCLRKARQLAEKGMTVVVVLHDLNLAAQFADFLLLMKNGRLLAMGTPSDLLEPGLIASAYGIHSTVIYPEGCDHPVIIPIPGPEIINQKKYVHE